MDIEEVTEVLRMNADLLSLTGDTFKIEASLEKHLSYRKNTNQSMQSFLIKHLNDKVKYKRRSLL